MQTCTTTADARARCEAARAAGRRIALVPTMGALHPGHASLLGTARRLADWVVASVFVNPTQFGPGEDFGRYPRQLDVDARTCEAAGVDLVFCPAPGDMYAADHSVYIVEGQLTRGLCGPHRPGHFRGVLTVVAQLFNVVQPQVAIFGQKDAQQARLIQQMVRDLHMPVTVAVATTVREADGLAMSSRNAYLDPGERQQARALSAALREAEAAYAGGERAAASLLAAMRARCLAEAPDGALEYLEVVDFGTLAPVDRVADGTLLAICMRLGKTRLIDNVILGRDRVASRFGLC